ncbi:methyltransferase family protein [Thalassotalea euphylliae]|uniref:methyltransferase family protein n=1 Tax=Thalassotalea euphylliae TaxID=1655234 RepID=UPI00362F22E9
MKKFTISLYGIIAYLIGLSGLTAFILFMGGWDFLPIHINSGTAAGSTTQAVLINLSILTLFGLHHSIAARASFKEKLAQYIPAEVERSTYVLVSGVFMYVLCLYWQPLSGAVWQIDNAIITNILGVIHIMGWLVMVGATFEIDHFHLMGLKQSLTPNNAEGKELKESFLYSIVRHPIQSGVLMGVWSTSYMSMTQFVLSLGLTFYIVIGLYFEEKSLIAHFGDTYLNYKKRVPSVVPFWPTH